MQERGQSSEGNVDLDSAIIDFLDNGATIPDSVATPAVNLQGEIVPGEVYLKPPEELKATALPPTPIVEHSLLHDIVVDAYEAIPRPKVVRRVAQAAAVLFTAGAK